MRTYTLTDRDFEELYNIIVSVEDKLKVQHKEAGISNTPLGSAISNYRYHLIGWRNRVMSGDTHQPMDYPVAEDTRERWKKILAIPESL